MAYVTKGMLGLLSAIPCGDCTYHMALFWMRVLTTVRLRHGFFVRIGRFVHESVYDACRMDARWRHRGSGSTLHSVLALSRTSLTNVLADRLPVRLQ